MDLNDEIGDQAVWSFLKLRRFVIFVLLAFAVLFPGLSRFILRILGSLILLLSLEVPQDALHEWS